jgi:hypothetical protein
MVQSFQQIAMILSVDWNQCSHIGTGFGPSEDRIGLQYVIHGEGNSRAK